MSRKHDDRGAISTIENDCEQLKAENEWLWRYVKHLLVKLSIPLTLTANRLIWLSAIFWMISIER